MHTVEYEVLAGRIDALSNALLSVTAELEVMQLIDGPRVSEGWRRRGEPAQASAVRKQAAKEVLGQLADLLDSAREHRGHR